MDPSIVLEPLRCSKCGALVPLGQGSSTQCRYCGTLTPVPQTYASLQAASKSFAMNRELSKQLYSKIGKPPGWILRTLGKMPIGS